MNKLIFLVCFLVISMDPSMAKSHFSVGLNKTLKDTQNTKGKVEDKPFSPYIAWGSHFKILDTRFGFSPQIGYIHTNQAPFHGIWSLYQR